MGHLVMGMWLLLQAESNPPSIKMVEQLTGILIPVAFFAMIVVIVWLKVRKSQAETTARAEFHKHLVEKFASGKEFADFLGTPGGQRLVQGAWLPQVNTSLSAKERILKAVKAGVVLTVMGLGTLPLYWLEGVDNEIIIPAVVMLALGIGFLISAAITYRLSEKMGLLRENGPGDVNASGSQP